MTFQNITINLKHPICSCEPDPGKTLYIWSIINYQEGPGLHLECRKCAMKLQVPNAQFKAGFKIENPNKKPDAPKTVEKKKETKRPPRKLPDYLRIVKEE